MKFKYNNDRDIIEIDDSGVELLESMYDDNLKRPKFIDLINKLSTYLGTYVYLDGVYIKSNERCKNIKILGTLNI